MPHSVSETSASTACSGSMNKAPAGSRGKVQEISCNRRSAEGLAHLVAQGRALHPPTPPQRANAPVIPPPSSIASRMGDRAGRSTGRVNFQGIKPPKKNTLPQEWWLDSTCKALCAMVAQSEGNLSICAFTAYQGKEAEEEGEQKDPVSYPQAVASPQSSLWLRAMKKECFPS